jgi:predicted enzyme related to lactoylglutathione lyase
MVEVNGYENGTPCWVDIGTSDVQAAGAFYSALFGWEVEYGSEEMGHYSMARLRGRDVAALADQQVPGLVVWTTYLAVDDLEATVAKARAAGGTVVMEPMDVMTFGRMAIVTDPGGAAVSFWQAGEHRGAGLVNEPGSLAWNELTTRAVDGSLAFLEATVGLKGHKLTFDGGGEYYELQLPGGRAVGGLMPMVGDMWPPDLPNHWMVYFAVQDTDATVARCLELGGEAPVPPTDIPPGRFAVLRDPQGGTFSVITLTPPG